MSQPTFKLNWNLNVAAIVAQNCADPAHITLYEPSVTAYEATFRHNGSALLRNQQQFIIYKIYQFDRCKFRGKPQAPKRYDEPKQAEFSKHLEIRFRRKAPRSAVTKLQNSAEDKAVKVLTTPKKP